MTDRERYEAALHAMQTGVAMWMEFDPKETSPKHLRVGINSALCDSTALAKVLIAKGAISEEEYIKALADQMEEEVSRYAQRLADRGIKAELV